MKIKFSDSSLIVISEVELRLQVTDSKATSNETPSHLVQKYAVLMTLRIKKTVDVEIRYDQLLQVCKLSSAY